MAAHVIGSYATTVFSHLIWTHFSKKKSTWRCASHNFSKLEHNKGRGEKSNKPNKLKKKISQPTNQSKKKKKSQVSLYTWQYRKPPDTVEAIQNAITCELELGHFPGHFLPLCLCSIKGKIFFNSKSSDDTKLLFKC